MLSDVVIAHIRTGVPIAVGIAIVWLQNWLNHQFGILLHLDSPSIVGGAVFVCSFGWYALVSWLEKRWPQYGWLIGHPGKPSYPTKLSTPVTGTIISQTLPSGDNVSSSDTAPGAPTGPGESGHALVIPILSIVFLVGLVAVTLLTGSLPLAVLWTGLYLLAICTLGLVDHVTTIQQSRRNVGSLDRYGPGARK